MRKTIITSIFLTLIWITCYSQQNYFTNNFSYTCDVLSNLNGGIKTGTGYLGMIKIDLNIDTEKAGLWKGGNLFVTGMNTHGFEPSKKLIGDFHTVSNIEAGDNTFIHELWYKQNIGNCYIKLGVTDLNTEFAVTQYGSFFINSSFGLPSVISGNIPVSTFPITNIGGTFHWQISNKFAIQTSLHKGISEDQEINESTHYFKSGDGWTSFTEIHCNYSLIKDMEGTYKVGTYFHIHPEFSDKHKTNYGLYFIADQKILNNKNGGDLGIFTQVGFCPKYQSSHNMYLGGGLHYSGLSKKRPKDEIGLAIAMANFSTGKIKTETALELSYKLQLHKHLSIQPNIQYIINPGNSEEAIDNALVGILRVVIE